MPMLSAHARLAVLTVAIATSVACGSNPSTATPRSDQSRPAEPSGSTRPARTLALAVGRPPESLASRPLREMRGPGVPDTALRMFNAGLALNDQHEAILPYLADRPVR